VLYTPHGVNLSALATAYGWQYRLVATMGELTDALSLSDARLMIDVTLQR
jgi:2-succinyl-5-enolpyruvyl-6-hydroxy-3-cyclohexene-1-carboxylate synthase